MTTQPDTAGRVAALADALEFGGWQCFASVELEHGGLVRVFRSKADARVTSCLSRHSRRGALGCSYRFADLKLTMAEACIPPLIGPFGRLFGSIAEAAAAVIAHDDMLARLRAPAIDAKATSVA